MQILVVGSCGKKKLNQFTFSPTCDDLASIDAITKWRKKSGRTTTRVRDLYTGNQNRELVRAVDILRKIPDTEVKLHIISAGFGLIEEKDMLPSYDCSFSGMRKSQIQKRAKWLNIPSDFGNLVASGFNLVYLALGKNYFLTLGDDWNTSTNSMIVGFNRRLTEENTLCVPSAHKIVSSFSKSGHKIHGVTGFKGDLLRVLANYASNQPNPYEELLNWTTPMYLRNLITKLGNLKVWN